MRTMLSAFAFALVAASLVACSGGNDTAASSSSSVTADEATSFCSSYCGRHAECDSSLDVQTCTAECEDATTTTLQRLRSDVIEPTRECFVASDCRQVLTGDRLEECIEEAAVSVAPTPAAKAFCSAFASAAADCDASVDRADCLAAVTLYSDEVLAEAQKCTEKSCGAMSACIDAELGL